MDAVEIESDTLRQAFPAKHGSALVSSNPDFITPQPLGRLCMGVIPLPPPNAPVAARREPVCTPVPRLDHSCIAQDGSDDSCLVDLNSSAMTAFD